MNEWLFGRAFKLTCTCCAHHVGTTRTANANVREAPREVVVAEHRSEHGEKLLLTVQLVRRRRNSSSRRRRHDDDDDDGSDNNDALGTPSDLSACLSSLCKMECL